MEYFIKEKEEFEKPTQYRIYAYENSEKQYYRWLFLRLILFLFSLGAAKLPQMGYINAKGKFSDF